ncbi:glycosyltransferase [Prosthecomicrobium sp. N25]|uniref:glycosyltransferase n=1 Tax=Prosthecomicrobium sp. N25 TaxID=3129254 RepID=UPI0030780DCD
MAPSRRPEGPPALGGGALIFVTVGSMLPFDRLVRSFDAWAAAHPEEEAHIQIGTGRYEPVHVPWSRMLDGRSFEEKVASASLIVSHAGTGTVFAAFEHAKPIVIVPRYAALREHTTDHQLHTAAWLRGKPGIVVCEKDEDLAAKIAEGRGLRPSGDGFSKTAPRAFTDRLRRAIADAVRRDPPKPSSNSTLTRG